MVQMEQTLFVRARQVAPSRALHLSLAPGSSADLHSLECALLWETSWHSARFLRRNDYKSGNLPSAKVARIDYRE